jgi:putative tryptophan/tyrosine transport system substrate-binding protein
MRRRALIVGLGLAAVRPMLAYAQQQAMPVIGFATDTNLKMNERFLASVRRGLAEYGYVEGQNFRFEFREGNLQNDILPILFRKLVDERVTLIVTNTTLQTEAAKATTQSIPIVFDIASDPVENGFVSSLNKPGGNITGIYSLGVIMTGKRLEVLHELVPYATKMAFLTDPGNTTISKLQMQQIRAAADSLGLSLLSVYARSPDEFEAAFDTATRGGAGGMVVGADGLFAFGSGTQLVELVALAARYRLPTIYGNDRHVKAGGLISYAVDWDEVNVAVGRYASRILKGEKPADLPVQQSTKTILIINLKTAKALGTTVPLSLLGRADEVIE